MTTYEPSLSLLVSSRPCFSRAIASSGGNRIVGRHPPSLELAIRRARASRVAIAACQFH
jgi:hypothetical protein